MMNEINAVSKKTTKEIYASAIYVDLHDDDDCAEKPDAFARLREACVLS